MKCAMGRVWTEELDIEKRLANLNVKVLELALEISKLEIEIANSKEEI